MDNAPRESLASLESDQVIDFRLEDPGTREWLLEATEGERPEHIVLLLSQLRHPRAIKLASENCGSPREISGGYQAMLKSKENQQGKFVFPGLQTKNSMVTNIYLCDMFGCAALFLYERSLAPSIGFGAWHYMQDPAKSLVLAQECDHYYVGLLSRVAAFADHLAFDPKDITIFEDTS